jgi:hypothetical protein
MMEPKVHVMSVFSNFLTLKFENLRFIKLKVKMLLAN